MSFVDDFLDWAHQGLLGNDEAQAYLRGRGSSSEQWERHRIGFTIDGYDLDPERDPSHSLSICSDRSKDYMWCDSCRYRKWSSKWTAGDDGIKEQQVGARIIGCVVFPLTSYSGTTVGFQVRSIAEKAYDSFTILRRPEGYFFGTAANLEAIYSTREVTLVEGPGDELPVERLVMPNVLGLTTSAIGIIQLRFLRRFVDRVNLCMDLDEAGRKGVRTFIGRYGRDFDTRNVRYPRLHPNDKDPGDLWRRVGDVKFKFLMRRAFQEAGVHLEST